MRLSLRVWLRCSNVNTHTLYGVCIAYVRMHAGEPQIYGEEMMFCVLALEREGTLAWLKYSDRRVDSVLDATGPTD